MVLKIRTSGYGWIIKEIDAVQYFYGSKKDIEDEEKRHSLTAMHVGDKVTDVDRVVVLLLYKENNMFQRIIATQKVYLLNNEGKTIEKIN